MLLKSHIILVFIIHLFIGCFTFQADTGEKEPDWPQWRGPNRDGVWYENILLDTLKPENFRKLWESQVGQGYSGPTVANGRVYLTDYVKNPYPSERVLCFDAGSGKPVWTREYSCEYFNVGYPAGPRASVLINDGRAYSYGTMGHLFCFDAVTGEVLWQHNALEEYNARIPIWGLAASPIMEKDLLIVQLGGQPGACLVAFDKVTGREIWRALDDEASYSAPIIIDQAGKRLLVCWTGNHIAGLNPDDGAVYWKIPFTPREMIMNISSPVYSPPYLFLSAFFDGSFLVRLDMNKQEADLVWYRHGENEINTDALHCCISTPIIKGGYIFGLDSYGEMRCLDLLTGDRIWEDNTLVPHGRWANVHFVRQGNRIWAFNELGEMILCEFNPEGLREYGRVGLIKPVKIPPNPRNGVCWAHPAFSGVMIYVRNDEKLVCYQLVQ
jgi:outer membrane protein assembly factor BamB